MRWTGHVAGVGRGRIHIESEWRKYITDRFKGLGIYSGMTLRWILERWAEEDWTERWIEEDWPEGRTEDWTERWAEEDWTEFIWLSLETVGCCSDGNEPLGCI
jgi:hypothetical protein